MGESAPRLCSLRTGAAKASRIYDINVLQRLVRMYDLNVPHQHAVASCSVVFPVVCGE